MGDRSSLLLMPDSSATVPIDWSKVPDASKKYFLQDWCYDRETTKPLPLPPTFGDLAKIFDGTDFFSCLRPELSVLLLDISEFGLAPPLPLPAASGSSAGVNPISFSSKTKEKIGPRFYMRYNDELWFLFLLPGKRDGVVGCSSKLRMIEKDPAGEGADDVAYDKARVKEELKVAEDIEAMLRMWVRQREDTMEIVEAVEPFFECVAFTLQQRVEMAQLFSEIVKLPPGHSSEQAALATLMNSVLQGC